MPGPARPRPAAGRCSSAATSTSPAPIATSTRRSASRTRSGARPDERAILERLLARGLVDVGRTLHPDDDAFFTWWAPWRNLKQRNIGWRIDYVIASEALARTAGACVVQREIGSSDHGPVVATFS